MRRVAHARPLRSATAGFAGKKSLHSAVAMAATGVAVLALAGCSGGVVV